MATFMQSLKEDYFRLMIYGSSGSGKTYWLLHTLIPALKDSYDTIIVFTRSHNNAEYQKNIPDVAIINEDFGEVLGKIRKIQEKNIKGLNKDDQPIYHTRILLVWDDVLDKKLFNDKAFMSQFTNMRHLQTSTIVISQITNDIVNTGMKANTSHFVIFRINGYYQQIELFRMIESAIGNELLLAGIDVTEKELRRKAKKMYREEVAMVKYGHIMIDDNGIY